MSDDYLWDGSGEPDPEVQRLEKLLQQARYRPAARRFAPPRSRVALPIAAAVVLLVPSALAIYQALRPVGSVHVTRHREGLSNDAAVGSRLYEGNWLETDSRTHAEIAVANLGEVKVAPSSRVRLVSARHSEQRLELARGQIQARISAPPRLFIVDTPSATAVDLGCEYSLTVSNSGAGELKVTFGYVELTGQGKTALVPAGALCETLPGRGPGVPFAADAPPTWREALNRLDFEGDTSALGVVLEQARRSDALTLWHLLSRVDVAARQRVSQRLIALVPLPAGVSEQDVLQLRKSALDKWWDAIDDSE